MAFASIITGSVVAPSRLSLVRASPPSGKTLCRTTLVPSASRSFHSTRRHFSLPPSEKPLAFAFDIDGVLKAGPLVLPQAKRALRILEGENRRRVKIPYVFITNGGGKHEAERAKDLSRELEVLVTPDQVIQAHTVMRSLVPLYHDKPILMIGGPDHPPGAARKVMEGYGFERVYTSHDLHNYAPEAWPFTPLSPEQKEVCRVEDFSKIPFSAVLVFHDSREWGRDIQFITDVLRSEGGVFGTESSPERPPQTQIPLYFSHGDLLWGNNHSVVRFGQGAFRLALENVYLETTGRRLVSTVFGKPHRLTYEYADRLLKDLFLTNGGRQVEKVEPSVWMVGDNTESDIAGANGYGWSSALVRTGVYKDSHGPPNHKPTLLVDNVEEAVSKALDLEWSLK